MSPVTSEKNARSASVTPLALGKASLEALREAGVFEPLDVHFARTIGALGEETNPDVLLAAALVSRQTRAGHVCVLLSRFGSELVEGEEGPLPFRWPEADAWEQALEKSSLVSRGDERRPLVLDEHGRLYLHRYYEHEARLAELLRERAEQAVEALDEARLVDGFHRLFGPVGGEEIDGQRMGVLVALTRRLAVISGGPGTGKTSTVVRILALLVEQFLARGERAPRVVLLAPTGKAAARLVESIRGAKSQLELSPEVSRAITEEASTIHRALGVTRDSANRYLRNAERPLIGDVVLVDEASMVDLSLMRNLVEAVPPEARLILLGDRHQLASVEAGSVLAELCAASRTSEESGYAPGLIELYQRLVRGAGAPGGKTPNRGVSRDARSEARSVAPLACSVVELTRSYRFKGDSAIGRVSGAVRRGDVAAVFEGLAKAEAGELTLSETAPAHALAPALARAVVAGYRGYLKAASAEDALRLLGQFRVLAAHRRGFSGVEHLNTAIRTVLADAALVPPKGSFFRGRPGLITQNDDGVGLFNGDVGLTWPNARGELRVHFLSSDGRLRELSPARLPAHETAFALSVHKSQGSEHDEIALVLPDLGSPLLTRELLYTAITRAKKRVQLFGTKQAIEAAVRDRVVRESGLAELLARPR